MSPCAYIGFGANLGNREATFEQALNALGNLPGTTVNGCSRLYETEPVGLSDDGSTFLNAAIRLETELSPRELMEWMRRIERDLGKAPDHKSDLSRIIDLDLLLYEQETIVEEDITVPHPRMHVRGFVLIPLAEIAPGVRHTTIDCTVADLILRLPEGEREGVRPFERRGS